MNRQMRRAAASVDPKMAAAIAAQGQQVVQVVQQVAAPLNDVQACSLLAGLVLAGGVVTDPEEAVAVAHKVLVFSRLKIGELAAACQAIAKAEKEAAESEAKRQEAADRPKSDVVLIPEG